MPTATGKTPSTGELSIKFVRHGMPPEIATRLARFWLTLADLAQSNGGKGAAVAFGELKSTYGLAKLKNASVGRASVVVTATMVNKALLVAGLAQPDTFNACAEAWLQLGTDCALLEFELDSVIGVIGSMKTVTDLVTETYNVKAQCFTKPSVNGKPAMTTSQMRIPVR